MVKMGEMGRGTGMAMAVYVFGRKPPVGSSDSYCYRAPTTLNTRDTGAAGGTVGLVRRPIWYAVTLHSMGN